MSRRLYASTSYIATVARTAAWSHRRDAVPERCLRRATVLGNATPNGERTRFLLRDRDSKFGAVFDRVATWVGIRVLRTPVRAPRANAICERFLGSMRREGLDHLLVERILADYARNFNADRPHQGSPNRSRQDRLGLRTPTPASLKRPSFRASTTHTAAPDEPASSDGRAW
jgi:transposase InsO family protein